MTFLSDTITINDKQIGKKNLPYCIAEVGLNHNGDINIAKRMIEVAKEAGADAVKFQTFRAEQFCGDPNLMFTYKSQGKTVTESMLKMFQRCELANEDWEIVKKHCEMVGISFFSTPQNKTDLDVLVEVGVPAIKVGSDDFTNIPLLRNYASSNLPLILSCGMADLAEVHQALEAVGWYEGYPVALLLCTSQYPTPPHNVNIKKLTTLQQSFEGLVVGFSDHTQGSLAASMAVAVGAKIFEKHFTLSKEMAGPDHWFAEDPLGLKNWVSEIHRADQMLGSQFVRPTAEEREMRTVARRSVVAVRDISINEKFDGDNIGLRRPGDGLSPELIGRIIGLRATRVILKGEKLLLGDMHA